MKEHAGGGLEAVIALAMARHGEPLTLADLAAAAGLPQNKLTRLFKRAYGLSPMRWLWSFRVILAAELIAATPDGSLITAAERCGFASQAHFSRRFRELFGESPSRFRERFRQRGGEAARASDDELAARAARASDGDLAARAAAKAAVAARCLMR